MEKREPATKRGAHLRTRLVYIMAMMSFFFIYKVLDPLGLESATKQTSAGLFNALTAPFYGADNANTHRHVAVVEVNDASLERFGTAFPLSYTRHIAILNQILDAHPAAVFVDFRMMREQPGETLDSFAPLLARAHSMNVPLLFARGEAGDKQPSLPPILKPDQVYSNGLESTGSYPLVEEKDEATETSKAVNPAWALYETLCRNAWTARCGDIQAENFDRPMVIRWGLAPDPAQSLVSNQGDYWQSNCAIWREGPCTRLTAASRLALAYLFLHSRGSEKQFAFYPLVIGAEQLGHSSRNTLPGSPALAALLTDRAVFYGSDIRDQHDDSVVPLLGRVPGVVTHAMAFDNLVTYGARYFHEPPELAQIGWLRLDKAELLEALIWLMCSIALIMRPKSKPLGKYTGDDVACTTRQHRKHQARSSIRRRTLACMLGAFLIVAVPTLRNHTPILLLDHAVIWLFVTLLFLGAWTLPTVRAARAKKEEDGERGLVSQLCFLASLSAIGFALNEAGPRWPNADWIGLLLLWLAASAEEEHERNRFVQPLCRILNRAIDLPIAVHKVGRRLLPRRAR